MALFLPELFLLLSCLVIFILTLGKSSSSTVRNITAALSVIAFLICVASLKLEGELFFKIVNKLNKACVKNNIL